MHLLIVLQPVRKHNITHVFPYFRVFVYRLPKIYIDYTAVKMTFSYYINIALGHFLVDLPIIAPGNFQSNINFIQWYNT